VAILKWSFHLVRLVNILWKGTIMTRLKEVTRAGYILTLDKYLSLSSHFYLMDIIIIILAVDSSHK
jgi:hypothetical protein